MLSSMIIHVTTGTPAIREWAKRDIIGESLTMNATKVINHYGNFIVTANIDGTIISAACLIRWCSPFYFTPQSDIIRRNRFDI